MTVGAEAKQTILIIDDSEDDRDVCERLLRNDPHISQILKAETGKQGIGLFETVHPDCVLLDFNLPGHDGLDVLRRIRALNDSASVVMLTGEGSEDIAVAAMKAGASDYVVKDSLSTIGLRRAVTNAIDKTALQRKIASQQEEQRVFLRTLLHDARAPLRHISDFSQLITEDIEAGNYDEMPEYCGDLQIATKRIEDLLDTLASYALAETDVTFEPVDMNVVMKAVIANLSHRIEERQAVVRSDTLPIVKGHAPQMIQLLQNLVGNGIKYCKADKPAIEVTVNASDADDVCRFKVQDNGIGIPADKLSCVFQPFKRLWSHDVYEGTGLGLAICQKIIKRHGGTIWCESEDGQGSAFFFTLPRAGAMREDQRMAS